MKNRNMWNVNDARMGDSEEWHALYYQCRTKVIGFISLSVTLLGVRIGVCQRGWGVTKGIKYGHCAKLTGAKTEKTSIISRTNKLNKARIKRNALQELECKDTNALWGEEEEIFDLVLEKFGVDIGDNNETPTGPEQISVSGLNTRKSL